MCRDELEHFDLEFFNDALRVRLIFDANDFLLFPPMETEADLIDEDFFNASIDS